MARTMVQKIWDDHVVTTRVDGSDLLMVDRHILNEGSSVQAFVGLDERDVRTRYPHLTLAIADHVVPTQGRHEGTMPRGAERLVQRFASNAAAHGIPHIGVLDGRQGICHVVAPEQGFILPGLVVVCADSHTSTGGALGALAFGIGTSEAEHVMATGVISQHPMRAMRLDVTGRLADGVTAKDLVLALIGEIGAGGAAGYVIEYTGDVVRALDVEERMTLCNMSIEAGARVGLIAPDETTFEFLEGRPMAPSGTDWNLALDYWRSLPSDPGAQFDRVVTIDGGSIAPQVTWGTSPHDVEPVGGAIPIPEDHPPERAAEIRRSLKYMDLQPGIPVLEIPIDVVFIGSCTNARLSDLRAAAQVLAGRRLADSVSGIVVPGSTAVKAAAEREHLDDVFLEAGFEWRDSACSMCAGITDVQPPGTRVASTSNRNFENRQGRGVRTHLMSPAMAAAAAVTGHVTDVRSLGGP